MHTVDTTMWNSLDITSVLSAGEFYVIESPNSSETSRRFYEFDKRLNEEFNEKHRNGFLSRIMAFKAGQNVIAMYKERWCRGTVRLLRNSRDHCDYQVFLYDYGIFVNLPESKVYALTSGAYSAEPCYSKKIKLGHIVPISMGPELAGTKLLISLDERHQWDSAATDFVRNIQVLSSGNKFEEQDELNGMHIGEFFVCISPPVRRYLVTKLPGRSFEPYENLGDLLVQLQFGKRRDELLPKACPRKAKSLAPPGKNLSSQGSSSNKSSEEDSSYSKTSSNSEENYPSTSVGSPLQTFLKSQKEVFKSPGTPETECDIWSPFARRFKALDCFGSQQLTNISPVAVLRKRNDSNIVYNDFCELPEPRFRFPSTNFLARRLEKGSDSSDLSFLVDDKENTKGEDSRTAFPPGFFRSWGNKRLDITRLVRVYSTGVLAVQRNEILHNLYDFKPICNNSVYRSLEERDFRPCDLQLIMWPTVIRGRSCVAIDRNKSIGKTMGFLAPLISSVMDTKKQLSELKRKKTGPLAIIVCSTSIRAIDLAAQIEKLVEESDLKVLTMYAGCSEENASQTSFRLSIGTHILVTTMQCLQRIGVTDVVPEEKNLSQYVSLERCATLVFDDIEDIMNIAPKKTITLLEMWIETMSMSHQLPKQFVMTANGWSEEVQQIMPLIEDLQPSIIISSILDAVIYKSIETHTQFICGEYMHYQAVVDLVSQNRNKKILVFVENSSQAAYLQKLLHTIAIVADFIYGDYHYAIAEKLCYWKGSRKEGAVCLVDADAVEPLLNHDLRDADLIIHLSPPKTCYDFTLRYSFMLDNLSNFQNPDVTCASYVILSEDVIAASPRFIDELRSMNAIMDPRVEEAYERTMDTVKVKRKNRALCALWKALGFCSNDHCWFRHEPDSADIDEHLPLTGEISFEIITVLSPIRFTIKIKQYMDPETSETFDLQKYHHSMFSYLQMYFMEPEERSLLKDPVVGKLCALKGSHAWVRADIQEVQTEGKIVKCKVFLIDEGTYHLKASKSLYELPEECASMPALVSEVFISNVKPVDLGTEFTPYASTVISDRVRKPETTFYRGRVVLTLENTIWVAPIVQVRRIGSTHVTENLRKVILDNDLGVDDGDHLTALNATREKLFKRYDWMLQYESAYAQLIAKCPKLSKQNPEELEFDVLRDTSYEETENLRKPQTPRKPTLNVPNESLIYATLPLNEFVPIEIGNIESPNSFCLSIKPSSDKMHQIRSEIAATIGECEPFNPNSSEEVYLAPTESGEYQRCKILAGGSTQSECKFIDSGYSSSVDNNAIRECPTSVVSCVEALSIEASLCGDFSAYKHAAPIMTSLIKSEENWFAQAVREEVILGEPKYEVELHSMSDVFINGLSSVLKGALAACQPSTARNSMKSPNRFFSRSNSISQTNGRVDGHPKTTTSPEARSLPQPKVEPVPRPIQRESVTPKRLSFGRGKPIKPSPNTIGACNGSNTVTSTPERNGTTTEEPYENGVQNRVKTFWSQTQSKLTLKFFVSYSGTFDHKLETSRLQASVKYNDQLCTIDEDLYANLDTRSARLQKQGKYMVLTCNKCVNGKWPRLLSRTGKPDWLKVDETDLTSSDESLARPPSVQENVGNREPKFLGGMPMITTSCESLYEDSDASSVYSNYNR